MIAEIWPFDFLDVRSVVGRQYSYFLSYTIRLVLRAVHTYAALRCAELVETFFSFY